MKTVTVDAAALRQLLEAFLGPIYYVNELRVIYDLGTKFPDETRNNPVGLLIKQYNEAAEAHNKEPF